MKVDFFLIGPPRCGSTSLSHYAASHRKICFSKPKEPTFFCTDIRTGYSDECQSIDEYHQKYFSHFDPRSHEICGDGTPLYLMSDVAIKKVLEYNSGAKFVALARNPIDLAHSMHAARVRLGLNHENIPYFPDAWNAIEDRLEGKRLPPNCIREAVLNYRRLASIGTQFERFYNQVPPTQRHVIVFDDLKSNFNHEARKMLEFLALDPAEIEFEGVHKEAAATWKGEVPRRLHHLGKRLASKMTWTPRTGLLKKFKENSLRPGKGDPLDPAFRQMLREQLDDEIKTLSRLLGRDFGHWE